MTYKLKQEHGKNWDAQNSNNQSMFNDEQDSIISERSSIPSLNDNTLSSNSNSKQIPTVPAKAPHTLRYGYNELPENGVPLAIQVKNERKAEKKRQKAIRRAPPGQGSLAPIVEAKPPEMGDHYYPYWYYYKMKNPDWVMRHRQTNNGQLVPHETVDPSQYVHKPGELEVSTKPSGYQRRSRRHRGAPTIRYNYEKQQYEPIPKEPSSLNEPSEEQRPDGRKYIPLKDSTYDESRSPRQGKLKTETDWNDHYLNSRTNKSSQEFNDGTTIPTRSSRRRSKHRHRHHTSLPDIQQEQQSFSQSARHHHHHHHHHHDYLPSMEYLDSEFQVIDASFKRSERTAFFQQRSDPYLSAPPAIYNQSSYLPPLRQEFYFQPNPAPNFSRDWNDPTKAPKIYKPDAQTTFYDRYLNDVIDKK